MKYRKKPVVIDAVQFSGFHPDSKEMILSDRPTWFNDAIGNDILLFGKPDTLTIKTLEGDMLAQKGDFIIQGVNGEIYPCKPDIFAKTYDLA